MKFEPSQFSSKDAVAAAARVQPLGVWTSRAAGMGHDSDDELCGDNASHVGDVGGGSSMSVKSGGVGAAIALAALAAGADKVSPQKIAAADSPLSGGAVVTRAAASSVGTAAEDKSGLAKRGANPPKQLSFLCTLCNRDIDVAERVPGFSWGRTCKRAYDSLARMSKRQNEQAWWEELKTQPKKMKTALMDYMKMFPDGAGRGSVRGKGFKMAEYKEFLRSTTEVHRRRAGKMMWEEEWLEYARTVEGGGYTRAAAKTMWDDWAKPSSGVLRCDDGPRHSPLMLRVSTGIYVDDVNTFAVGKDLSLSNGPIKKPTEADIGALRQRAMSGHDVVAGMDVDVDMAGIAKAMVEKGGGSGDDNFSGAFSHEGLVSIDLRQQLINKRGSLQKSTSKSALDVQRDGAAGTPDDESKAEDDAASENEGDDSPVTPKKKKKKVFFQADKVNANNVSKWSLECMGWSKNAQSLVDQMQTNLAHVEQVKEADRAVIAPTVAVLKAKHEALKKVMATGPSGTKDLEEYLAGFGGGGQSKSAPPIERYMNLKTLEAMSALGERFTSCASQDDVKRVQKELQHHKDAVVELLRQCKGAISDIKRAAAGVMRLEKLEGQMASGQVVGEQAGKRARKGTSASIWESFGDLALEAQVFADPPSKHDLGVKMDMSMPIVITQVQHFKTAVESKQALAVHNLAFKVKWMKWKEKTQQARASKVCKDEEATIAALDSIRKLFPPGAIVQPDAAALENMDFANACRLSHFAMKQGESFCQYETDGLATIRVSVEGTRSVACAPFEDIARLVRKIDILGEQTIVHPDRAITAFRNLTKDQLKEYMDVGAVMLMATVGAYDLLYLPAGWMCHEIVLNRFDVFGYKTSIIVNDDIALHALPVMQAMGASQEVVGHVERLIKAAAAAHGGDAVGRPASSTPVDEKQNGKDKDRDKDERKGQGKDEVKGAKKENAANEDKK